MTQVESNGHRVERPRRLTAATALLERGIAAAAARAAGVAVGQAEPGKDDDEHGGDRGQHDEDAALLAAHPVRQQRERHSRRLASEAAPEADVAGDGVAVEDDVLEHDGEDRLPGRGDAGHDRVTVMTDEASSHQFLSPSSCRIPGPNSTRSIVAVIEGAFGGRLGKYRAIATRMTNEPMKDPPR